MGDEKWPRVREVLDAALSRQPEDRQNFVKEACGKDKSLLAEVQSLLSYHDNAESFMETPAVAIVAGMIEADMHRLEKGQNFGRYEIIEQIGEGGMGEVYLAEDTRLGRKVALKLLPPFFTADTDRVRRFEHEARAASALNHPNVCTIHEVGDAEGGRRYIVMEYVEGETLRQRLQTTRLEVHETLDIAIQVAAALDTAHRNGIVHRDIKPENVMLREDGLVKVLDFGLAKLTETKGNLPVDPQAPTRPQVRTNPGVVMGTVTYMSPEQARGLPVDARTDIWSCGVTLYEMLAGQTPFAGASVAEVMSHILEHEPAPLARYMTAPPAEIQRIVNKALKKNPSERYQTIKDMMLDLKTLKQDLDFTDKLKRSGSISESIESKATAITTADLDTRPTSSTNTVVERINRNKIGLAIGLSILALIGVVVAYQMIQARRQRLPNQTQRALSRLTFDAGLQSQPTWSPDGRFIAYSSGKRGNFDIWVQLVGGGDAVQVTHSPAHDWHPDWSPDGSQIVFRSEREGGGLFVVPALGGREHKVSPLGYRPRWSPDGTRILFSNQLYDTGDAPSFPKLYIVTPDGNPPREVLSEFLADFVQVRPAIWHPDGRRVSLFGMRRNLGWELWTVAPEGGTAIKSELDPEVEKQLKEADFSWTLSNFWWSPSGQALYFDGRRRGVRNLWRVSVDPQTLRWVSGPERLTTGFNDTDTTLSPDGRRLAFTVRTESTRAWSLPFDSRAGKLGGGGAARHRGRDLPQRAQPVAGRREAVVRRLCPGKIKDGTPGEVLGGRRRNVAGGGRPHVGAVLVARRDAHRLPHLAPDGFLQGGDYIICSA